MIGENKIGRWNRKFRPSHCRDFQPWGALPGRGTRSGRSGSTRLHPGGNFQHWSRASNACQGEAIGNAKNASGQKMTHFQADVINSIAERQWRKRSGGQRGKTVTEEFWQMCKLEVSRKYEEDYHQLLAKHRQVFSHDKTISDTAIWYITNCSW